jgi:AcrR family transcriptional regulator
MSKAKTNTRELITQITVQLVNEKGFDNVTIDDICAHASLTKGAIYYYAKSKEDILGQYLMEEIGKVDRDRRMHFSKILLEEDSFTQLLLLVNPLLDVCITIGPEIILQVMLANYKGQYVTSLVGRGNEDNEIITHLIEKGQKQGIIKNNQKPDLLCEIVGDAMYGMMFYWCHSNAEFDLHQKVEEFLRGILDVKSAK